MDVQWAFVSVVITSFVHFILRIVLGRNLGPDGLGVFTLTFTIYLFGMQFAAFGIHAALTKYVAEYLNDKVKIRGYVSSGMTSSILTGAIMGFFVFLIAPYLAISFFKIPEMVLYLQLTALCYPFIAIQKAVLGTLNGFRRMDLFAFLNIIQNISIVVVSVILVKSFNMDVLGAVIGFVVPTIVIGILCPILIRDYLGLDNFLWNVPALRETTIFGFYVVLGNSIFFLNTQLSSILIGYFLNSIEVGIYAVATLLAQTLTLIPSAIQRITAPKTAFMYGKGNILGIREVLHSIMWKTFLITIVIALAIAFFGQYLIVLLFGNDFLSAYFPLLILLVGYTIFAPFMSVGSTLSSIGKVNIPFRIHAICGLFNLILNILLIPPFGINGAAYATTFSLIISFLINNHLINRYLKLDF